MSQNIVLDTCILQYTLKETWKNTTQYLLSELGEKGFGIIISEISVFECLRTIDSSAKEAVIQTIQLLNRYQVSEYILKKSADLYGYYRSDNQNKKNAHSISTEDIIIAATAVLTDSLILTTDFNDFPRPFFTEQAVWRAERKVKGKTKALYFYLLATNKKSLEGSV